MSDSQRLKELRKNLNLSQGDLSKALDVSQGYISEVERGVKGVSASLALKAFEIYGVNLNWLIGEKGPMYASDDGNLSTEDRKKIYSINRVEDSSVGGFPLLDLKAVKAYPGQLLNNSFLRELPRFNFPLPEIAQAMAFQVEGHAMEDLIRHQDFVIGTHVSNLEHLEPGNIYVVVTHEQVICKRLYEVKPTLLEFRSDHPDFGSKGIAVISVKEVWWVKYILSGNMRKVGNVQAESFRPKLSKREFEHPRVLGRREEEKG
ncbi:MAG: LexA family transcriptional regulator [Bacteroidia bacterium]|nr:LexA family transcriptional regulator [Bacteroidia bacterium]